MSDVIIVHGAWHQPAHYQSLAGLLRSEDLSVEVPDFHGLSLDESTALIEDIVAVDERPPVVVGHSFGGVAAGTVRGAAVLVFLTSWILDVGESPARLLGEAQEITGAPAEGLLVKPDDEGWLRLDPADAREKLYAGLDEDTAIRAVELLRPEPPSIFGATPSRVSWRNTPTIYIAGRDDRAIDPVLVRRFAARCSTAETWPTGHSPYLSCPGAVVDVVRRWR